MTADDKQEYLSVRTDRKAAPGRPAETVHLEFVKDQVVACIGEDLHVRVLQGSGIKIPLMNNRPLMLVNHDGEVSLPGVFLVGDARGPKYLRCKDFNDSTSYEQVVEKRNIKAAMVDAVKAIEVIAARAGMVVPKAEVAPVVAATPPPAAPKATVVPPTPSQPADAKRPASDVQLVSLHPDDSPEETFPLLKDQVAIGRRAPEIACADDVYMADTHAVLTRRGDGYALEDKSGGSGVWLRAKGVAGRPVGESDLVDWGADLDGGQAGQRLCRHPLQRRRRAAADLPHSREGPHHRSHRAGLAGSFDLSLSRRHAQFRIEGGKPGSSTSEQERHLREDDGDSQLANGDEFRSRASAFASSSSPRSRSSPRATSSSRRRRSRQYPLPGSAHSRSAGGGTRERSGGGAAAGGLAAASTTTSTRSTSRSRRTRISCTPTSTSSSCASPTARSARTAPRAITTRSRSIGSARSGSAGSAPSRSSRVPKTSFRPTRRHGASDDREGAAARLGSEEISAGVCREDQGSRETHDSTRLSADVGGVAACGERR